MCWFVVEFDSVFLMFDLGVVVWVDLSVVVWVDSVVRTFNVNTGTDFFDMFFPFP